MGHLGAGVVKTQPWASKTSRIVIAALHRIGWRIKRQKGSHRTLARDGWADFVFAFHDAVELGPTILKKIAKKTGLKPSDL